MRLVLRIDEKPPLLMLDSQKILRAFNKLFSHVARNSNMDGTIDICVRSSSRFVRIVIRDERPHVLSGDFKALRPAFAAECGTALGNNGSTGV